MERTNNRIPDAINHSITKNYTIIPNDMLRNPNISSKTKAILCLLLTNNDNWKSYTSTILGMIKEKKESLSNSLNELESFGYLRRTKYRNKITKKFQGYLWEYTDTPDKFQPEITINILAKYNAEPVPMVNDSYEDKNHNPKTQKPVLRKPENQPLIRLSYKNRKLNEINDYFNSDFADKIPSISWNNTIKKWFIYKLNKKEAYAAHDSMSNMVSHLIKIAGGDLNIAKQIVRHSIANNYSGIFPLSKTGTASGNNNVPKNYYKGNIDFENYNKTYNK